jgi:hypothetical protein
MLLHDIRLGQGLDDHGLKSAPGLAVIGERRAPPHVLHHAPNLRFALLSALEYVLDLRDKQRGTAAVTATRGMLDEGIKRLYLCVPGRSITVLAYRTFDTMFPYRVLQYLLATLALSSLVASSKNTTVKQLIIDADLFEAIEWVLLADASSRQS